MKIEVDLLRMDNEGCAVKMARTCAVALLSALPDDQAELAVIEWEAVRTARVGDAKKQRDALAADRSLLPRSDTAAIAKSWAAASNKAHQETARKPRGRPPGTRIIAPNDPEPARDAIAAYDGAQPLADCLSAKTANALTRAGYATLGDLEGKSGKFLRGTVDWFGKGAQAEVEAAMAAAGLALAPDEPAKRGRKPRAERATAPEAAAAAGLQEREPIPQTAPGRLAAVPPQDVGYAEARGGGGSGQPVVMVPGEALQDRQQTDASGNGAGEPPVSLRDLRELCRHAEAQVGREKVKAVFRKHGVTKLSEIKAKGIEAAFRADVMAALG